MSSASGSAAWPPGFALFHLAANALVKSVLFMSAGNIHRSYASRQLPHVTGAIRRTPVSGWLFLVAFLAITGTPPFAPFISEFNIVAAAFAQNHLWLGGAFLLLLGGIFLAMSDTVVKMIFGTPDPKRVRTPYRDTFATTAPLILALGLSLVLGLWLPRPLETMLQSAAVLGGGQAMSGSAFTPCRNGQALPLKDVPELGLVRDSGTRSCEAVNSGQRLACLCADAEPAPLRRTGR